MCAWINLLKTDFGPGFGTPGYVTVYARANKLLMKASAATPRLTMRAGRAAGSRTTGCASALLTAKKMRWAPRFRRSLLEKTPAPEGGGIGISAGKCRSLLNRPKKRPRFCSASQFDIDMLIGEWALQRSAYGKLICGLVVNRPIYLRLRHADRLRRRRRPLGSIGGPA
jgi:hypothetical protein